MPARTKHSSLLQTLVNYGRKSFIALVPERRQLPLTACRQTRVDGSSKVKHQKLTATTKQASLF